MTGEWTTAKISTKLPITSNQSKLCFAEVIFLLQKFGARMISFVFFKVPTH